MKKNIYISPTIMIVEVKSNCGLMDTSMKASKDTVSDTKDIGFSRGGGGDDGWDE